MKLYLIRHTKVECIEGVCYGQTDVDLSSDFDLQKMIISEKIKNFTFDCIYSSPLKRCFQLAEHICEQPCQIIKDDRLMELNFGYWEMQKWNDIQNTEVAKQWFSDYINTPCPGGEAFTDLLRRVKDFIDELKNKSFRNTVIVAHGGVLIAFQHLIEGTKLELLFSKIPAYGEIIELLI